MSSTEQPSSPQRAEEANVERLTPLQKKELEIDDLWSKLYNVQQENVRLRTRYNSMKTYEIYHKTFFKDMEAKDEIIKGLSNELSTQKLDKDSLSMDLANRDLEIKSCKELIVQLQGSLKDSLRKRYYEISASIEKYQAEVADARKVMDRVPSFVPLNASTKAESKEQPKPPQVKQSGSDTLVKKLESEKVLTASSDTTDNKSQIEKIQNEAAQAQVATGPPEESISSSDDEGEQKPDESVQTGFATATSQTRGKYWPRGVL